MRPTTILAADIVGYSRMMAVAEEDLLVRVADFRALCQTVVGDHGGRPFETAGDAVRARFEEPHHAVEAAIDLLERLRAKNAGYPLSRQMAIRIGIAPGEVIEDGGSVRGPAVSQASALEAIAPPGGISISQAAFALLPSALAQRFEPTGLVRPPVAPDGIETYTLNLAVSAAPASAAPTVAKVSAAPARKQSESDSLKKIATFAGAGILAASIAGAIYAAWPPEAGPPPAPSAPAVSAKPATAPPPATASAPKATPSAEPATKPPIVAQAPAANKPASDPAAIAPKPNAENVDWNQVYATTKRLYAACEGKDRLEAIAACRSLLKDEANLQAYDLSSIQTSLGIALRGNKQYDEAVTAFSAAIKAKPSAKAHNERGIAEFARGKTDAAVADFSEAIKLQADYGDAYNNRAWVYFKTSRLSLASADAAQATKLAPNEAYIWDTSGHIHEALGRKQAAIDDFRKALTIDTGLGTSKEGLKRLGATP